MNHDSNHIEQRAIIFYDGKCVLCNRTIKFILKFDKHQKFYFSDFTSQNAKQFGVFSSVPESVIVWHKNTAYYKSSGILKICDLLGNFWKIFTVFHVIPVFIRDFFYDLIAKNRYKIFGRYEHCPLPSPEFKSRFLE